jgi:hypothetical protein
MRNDNEDVVNFMHKLVDYTLEATDRSQRAGHHEPQRGHDVFLSLYIVIIVPPS